MKKTSVVVLLLCACLSLTACTASDPDNLFEMPSDNPESTTVPNTDSLQSTPEETVTYTGTYPYGTMQKGRNFLLLDNEVVFRHTENGKTRLYAYDLNTEEVRFFCDDATCKHGACVSADFFSDLEVYEGKLYGVIWTREQGNHFFPAVANGNDTEPIIKAEVQEFIHHEDKLYLYTRDNSLMVLEEGQNEPQMILEEFLGYEAIVVGKYLYAEKLGECIRIDLTAENFVEEVLLEGVTPIIDENCIYYWDRNSNLLYRCDLDGNNRERLLNKPVGFYNFDDEYFYYKIHSDIRYDPQHPDNFDIYRTPKDDPTKVEKIATLPETIGGIYTVPGTGKIFVENYLRDSSVEPVIYVMNIDGSDLKKLELPEA